VNTEEKMPQKTNEETVSTLLGNIRVRIAGQGPALVCWSSLMMDGRMWQDLEQHFHSRYTVVRIDPPGHGASSPVSAHFSLEECAVCLRQILDTLGFDRAVIIGNSWGGMTGAVFAAFYPERTAGAVLMNCTASEAPLKQKLEYHALARLARVLGRLPDAFVARAVKAFAGQTTLVSRPEVVREIEETVRAIDLPSVIWAVESIVPMRRDMHRLLSTIRSRVLVVAGAEDQSFTNAETRAMAEAIPGSDFRCLDRLGHLAALEDPERINQLVEDFLRAIEV